ncbi:ABC transporter permease [Halanaerobium salsuginis]|jgi:peptide/nickel transport system permease protein|uniref:Peptide/nickel transport system permease protein n=1 Tax=Halanaerobium salsuginis TaxID=29563 RepID=A0A1I4LEG8_9FIRM|nr:ABC transporter permease [Halanaerobium salsuginis]SFL89468.1 peptide/nickel transport system permease protein [Halanaerobium salsuginis]
MWRYITKRILIAIPVLIGISIVAFFLIRLVPGDTVTALLGANYNQEQAAALRADYGLDKPLITQYLIWVKNLLKGDFGHSFFTNQAVSSSIMERLPVTFELMIMSFIYCLLIAIPLGAVASLKKNSLLDYLATIFGLLGVSIPNFWLATILILVFSLHMGWFPSGGFVSFFADPIANLRYMFLPSIALGASVGAVVMRMTRSSMLEILKQDYIEMARAKGVSQKILIISHALKNALIPVITVLGIQMGYLLGGSVIIEQIFSLPGIGRLALQAITNRDYILMQGSILFVAAGFVIINLLVDLIYALINPQIRY